MERMKTRLKRVFLFLLSALMLFSSLPLSVFAKVNYNYDNLTDNKSEIVNKLTSVKPAKPENGKTAEDLIKNPKQPEIYTLRTDYKVQRGEKYEVNYQPYIASVGAAATQAEKEKVDKTITLPDLAGYEKPDDNYKITYDKVKDAGNNGSQEFKYKAKSNTITIKHVFQDLHDFTKYTNPDGSDGEEGQLITTQNGNTGSTMEVSPLGDKHPNRKGFVPEAPSIIMQVPENAEHFILEYRYNRAYYDVNFATDGGTAIPNRTLYYDQTIPKIDDKSIPTKAGCDFLGWKPSVELKTKDGKTYPENQIIKDSDGKPILNLAADLKMPASKITFTAVWKDKPKAEYVIQFWTEKADYDDKDNTLPLRDRYDFIGARRVDNADTGSTPDLTNLDIHGITFPDLNDGRLQKAQNDPKEFARYYFLNKDLTEKQNASKKDPTVQKSVLSTGETVYNVYYDRRVYTLYFTSINNEYDDYAYWPIITKDGQVLGKEGAPYKVDVRFNQSLDKIWPKDEEISGLPKGDSTEPTGDDGLIGWMINHNNNENGVSIFRDTPPYRLSAEDFIDAKDVMSTEDESGGKGHADKIPIGENETKDRGEYEISLGASYIDAAIAYHIDIIKDDFEGKEQIDYDMSYWKSDTNTYDYEFILPHLQGFTLKKETRPAILIGKKKADDVEKTFDELNEERNAITPFRSDADKIEYISHFPWSKKLFDGTNAYDYANYTRNKYKLKLNNDPKTVKNDSEYGAGNILDVPYEKPLKDLKLDTTHKPEKPNWVRYDWSFLGWALDPAGENLVKDGKETKLNYDQVLYAKWGEPDYKWKVIFDPNGGSLRSIDENNLTTERKTVKEGDIGQEIETTYPIKEKSEGDKQVFKVFHKQKLEEPSFKPVRKGYDFMGWEIIRYKKDATTGDYTDVIDTSYRDTYKVPELYSFGNDVVSPIYLKAIWVPNARVDVKVLHYYLDKDYNLDKSISPNPDSDKLENKRADYLVATTGDRQDDKYTLVPHDELMEKLPEDLKAIYEEYNGRVKGDNTFFQQFRVEPEKVLDDQGVLVDNPKVADNVFKFFYRPYRHREYKVNYIDERFKGEANEKDGAIIDQELVTNGNRHFDARNYRQIPGWVLTSAPQQQLFFDVNEKTNAFLGINGTGKDEITFYYKDVRVIEVPEDGKTPDGYVRVTFKADKGGAFTDNTGKSVTELHYDVIKGLKSDLLPVPQELKEGETADANKYYITPDDGKKFTKWDNKPLLNKNTIINEAHTFTAYFEWSGLTAKGMVRTEAFNDPNGKWTNDFAPTIDELKAQLEWREKDVVKPLPKGTVIKLFDENDNELTKDDQVFELVKEQDKADKDELVRTVNVKAKVTFTDGKEPQELTIPITVYKNVYEALNKEGDKPLFLKEAEGKKAEEGGLKEILKGNTENRYIKVTIKPNKDFDNKDDKVYYVNPNAWVEIPEVKTDGDSNFTNWTANIDAQNEEGKKDGIFNFGKRHKFTEDTIITPVGAGDVVEQTDPNKKPDVPNSYVKVIVKTTDKATDETAFEKTFWVNPTKEVTIDVTNPTGKTVAADPATVGAVGYTMNFSKWETEDKARTWEDKIVGQFTEETTILAKYSVTPEVVKPQVPSADTVHTPQGKTPTVEEITEKITPPDGKTIKTVTIVENPDVNNPGNSTAKVIVEYTDGSSVGTNDNPVVIPVEVHKNIIPEAPGGQRPKDALDNYVKVIFKAGTGGKLEGTLTGNFIYYVSPEVEVDMTEVAEKINKTPDTGYFVNGENWNNRDNKALRGTFTDPETVFEFVFDKSTDIVEKTDDSVKKPDGYVTVTFRADAHGKLEGDKTEKIYYVNPKAGIKLVELADGQTAGEKELAVPKTVADENYVFEKWYEAIDKKNPVTNNLEHVARFVKDGVTLTYNANGAEGKVPEGVTVAQGTSVRLASAAGLTKKDAKFAGWKIGKDIYQAGDLVTLEESKTAVAQWTNDENIIPYDPVNKPTTRPDDTYVRVSFAADKGLSLTEQKAYYVKKNAGIKLGDTNLVKPGYTVETGYKFTKWDKEDNLVITTDTTVTAKSTKLGTVIPATGAPNEKPEGYKEVVFKVKDADADKGSLEGVTKFYVNPTEYVTINPPTTKAKTGFEFGAWDKDATIPTVYKEDATITGSFNGLKDVIPKTNPDGSENKQPAGYKTVTFVIDPATGGKIADGEVTVYYVNPAKDVTVPQPKTQAETGYEFDKWNTDTTIANKYAKDTTVKGNFKTLPNIIPAIDDAGKTNAMPEGYVKVRFVSSVDGKLYETKSGNKVAIDDKVYYVNPKTNQAIGNLTKPEADPNVGFEQAPTLWRILGSANGSTTTKLDETKITDDMTLIAEYKPLPDVVPKTKDDGTDKPKDYITVKFSTEANGKISGTDKTIKELYINPLKQPIVLRGQDPDVDPNTGYLFSKWDVDINSAQTYSDNQVIKAEYTVRENIYTAKKPGYVQVVFKAGDNGALEGLTELWVKPGVAVELPQPKVDPNTGYNFDKWDNDTKVTLQASATPYEITAKYKAIAEVVPGDQAQPKGYVKVEFKADENGTLSGTTVYYVNPEKKVDLTRQANGIAKKPNIGYTADGGTWSPVIASKKYTSDAEYKFNFVKLENIGDKEHPGYVKVEFIAGKNGELEGGNKTYYINPLEGIKPGSAELPIPEPKANQNYVFDSWYEAINKDEPITKDKTFVARFKLNKVTLTYEANDKTSGTVPAALSYDIGTEIILAGGNDLKKDNYVLTGWDIDGTTYAPGAKYKITKNTIAKAVWEAGLHTVEFDTIGAGYIPAQKVKHQELITLVDNPQKDGYTFTGWKVNGKAFDLANDKVTNDITLVAQYVKNVVEQTDLNKKPDVPNDFVKVIVKTTEKATDTTAFEKTFWVAPNRHVTIPVVNPIGRDMPRDGDKAAFTYVFTKWTSDDNHQWEVIIGGSFDKVTTITAQYDEKPAIPGDLLAETYYTSESLVRFNNYLPREDDLKALIKVRDDDGNPISLGVEDKIEFVPGEKANGTQYASLDEEIYDKLKENGLGDLEEISRTEKIKAKVTFANGTVNEVEIPIVVYKNIYEGLTNRGDKPKYVEQAETDLAKSTLVDTKYVRVTLIPTAKAKNQQRKTYYVRKNASVIIPEIKAEGRDAYEFIYWKAEKPGKGQDNPNYGWATRSMSMFRSAATAAKNDLVDNNEKVNFDGRMSFDQDTDIVAQYKTPTPTPDEPDKPNPDYPKYPDYPEYRPNYSGGSTIYIEKPVEKVIKVPDNAFVKEVRYMQGFEGKFRPFDGLTRAEAAQILANALKEDGYKYDPNYKISYKDIGNAWYTEAVKIVTQANVFKGYDDGNFKPQEKITRAEWIGTLKRFQELRDLSGNHMNLREGHWAMAEIEAAYQAGWLAIYSDGLADFKADEFIPRQEVAAVSNKAFERVLDKTYIKRNDKALVNYKDINDKMWSYEDILCASNTFLHDKKLYRAHGIDMSNEIFNINLDGFTITKDKFQRIER